jgi:hypothetical protein
LDQAVRDEMKQRYPGRKIVEIKFYNCKYTVFGSEKHNTPAYSAIVKLESVRQEGFNTDVETQWKIFAYHNENQWALSAFICLAES